MFHNTEPKKINVIMKRKTENNKKKVNTWFELEVRCLCHLMNYLHQLNYNQINYH